MIVSAIPNARGNFRFEDEDFSVEIRPSRIVVRSEKWNRTPSIVVKCPADSFFQMADGRISLWRLVSEDRVYLQGSPDVLSRFHNAARIFTNVAANLPSLQAIFESFRAKNVAPKTAKESRNPPVLRKAKANFGGIPTKTRVG